MQIDVDMDQVTINGQVVKRPTYLSRSQWMIYWDAVKHLNCPYMNCPLNLNQ